MSRLGFTFFPKDWWTSDSFYALNPFERYIYLELLFMMYDNGGSIINDKVRVERRLNTTIRDDVWLRITDLMIEDGDQLTNKSVNKRLSRAISSRENGKKGGRPKKEEPKPRKPKNETQNNPPYKREREIEKEIENNSRKITLKNGQEKIISVHLFPFMQAMLLDQLLIERLCMNNHLRPDMLIDYIKQFFVLRSNENNTEIQVLKEAQAYFSRWLICELEKDKKNNEQNKKESSIGAGLNIVG